MAMCIYIYLYYPLEPGFGLSAVLANFRQNPSAGAGCTSDRFWTWEQNHLDPASISPKGWLYSSAPAGFAPSRISPHWRTFGAPMGFHVPTASGREKPAGNAKCPCEMSSHLRLFPVAQDEAESSIVALQQAEDLQWAIRLSNDSTNKCIWVPHNDLGVPF